MTNEDPTCARCNILPSKRLCQNENGKAPDFCPTLNKTEALNRALKEYAKEDVCEFAKQASIQEGSGYGNKSLGYEKVIPIKPRIQETIEFAERMRFKRLGLVFCVGLRKETKVIENLFSERQFDVVSTICKVGRVPKETLGIHDDQKIRVGNFEAMCNPIAQALMLNDAGTEFNIVIGLCVGHDSLFLKYSAAPCTVLATKDRLLGHNPLAAVYTVDSYYRALKNQ